MHAHYQRRNPLDIGELAEFDKNIENLTADQKQNKRRAYLRQAIDANRKAVEMVSDNGGSSVWMMIIPLFWPMLLFKRKARRILASHMKNTITAACDYWGFDPAEFEQPIGNQPSRAPDDYHQNP